jgi:hypothetical protein
VLELPHHFIVFAKLLVTAIRQSQDEWDARGKYVTASQIAAGAFDLNMPLVLAMQQIGGRGSEAIV